MSLTLLREIGVNTLVLSSMYILASLGFAFIFNMLGTINLAHGAMYMIGAYICYYISVTFGLSNWVAMLLSAILLAAFGILLEKYMFRPFLDDFSKIIMLGVALMTIMQTTTTILSGTKTLRIEAFAEGTSDIAGVTVSNEKIVTFTIGIVLLLVVVWMVSRSSLGRQMEAVAQDRLGAALQGIPIHRVSAMVCAIGCGLVAISGSLMGAYQKLSPYMGDNMNLRILMLVMLAGAGSTNGIIITGVVMGLLDSFFPVVFDSYIADAAVAAIVVVLLLIKPKGFFGHEM
jgi:branched-chain amino acid transport system permease protein